MIYVTFEIFFFNQPTKHYIILSGKEEVKGEKKCYRSKCSSNVGLDSPCTTYSGGSLVPEEAEELRSVWHSSKV